MIEIDFFAIVFGVGVDVGMWQGDMGRVNF
jgi:hypothetical protein